MKFKLLPLGKMGKKKKLTLVIDTGHGLVQLALWVQGLKWMMKEATHYSQLACSNEQLPVGETASP